MRREKRSRYLDTIGRKKKAGLNSAERNGTNRAERGRVENSRLIQGACKNFPF